MKLKTLLLIVVAAVLALAAGAPASFAVETAASDAKADWKAVVEPPSQPGKGEGWTPVEPDPASVQPVELQAAPPATPSVEAPVEPEPEPEPTPAPVEPEPVDVEPEVKASNESLTIQVVVQVQRGCRLRCTGGSQTQVAQQAAETVQKATAEADTSVDEEPTAAKTVEPQQATALNSSRTVQFIWQAQLGCVAFCYGNSQTQVADQSARTDQLAVAAGIAALAANESSTSQFVWQYQRGCRSECYANSQSQSIEQSANTFQEADSDATGLDSPWQAELTSLQSWATNFGATIQVVTQFQDASCQEDCSGESQAQSAVQQALTAQEAVATAANKRHKTQDGESAPA